LIDGGYRKLFGTRSTIWCMVSAVDGSEDEKDDQPHDHEEPDAVAPEFATRD
jgi:hypothetical protein